MNQKAMPVRLQPNLASRRSDFPVETGAPEPTLDEQSGVRALPRASLPPPHPATLVASAVMLAPADQARTRTSIAPKLRLEYSEHQASIEASQRLLLERAQRKARIKQAAAEATVRLAGLLRQQEENYREEMVWRAKLREVKQRLQEEAEWKATLAAAKAQLALAHEQECARREEAEWQAKIVAARNLLK